MAKKRKLNSKNPKYANKAEDNTPKILKKKLMCNAKVRDFRGDVVKGKTETVHGVWYENDPIKGTKEEKWLKKPNLN